MIRRFFSTGTPRFAKSPIAIRRKKANIAKQEELKRQRSPANIDPIVGSPTEFTRSLLTPANMFTATELIPNGPCLEFTSEELRAIQKAVELAEIAREEPNRASPHSSASRSPSSSKEPKVPDSWDMSDFEAEKIAKIKAVNEAKSAASTRLLALQNSNAATLKAYNIQNAIRSFGRVEGDTGSAEVQAAVLTVRILAEAEHISRNKKDVHGFRGFRTMVHKRQGLLKYLRREDVRRYFDCIERLGLVDQAVTKEITM